MLYDLDIAIYQTHSAQATPLERSVCLQHVKLWESTGEHAEPDWPATNGGTDIQAKEHATELPGDNKRKQPYTFIISRAKGDNASPSRSNFAMILNLHWRRYIKLVII